MCVPPKLVSSVVCSEQSAAELTKHSDTLHYSYAQLYPADAWC